MGRGGAFGPVARRAGSWFVGDQVDHLRGEADVADGVEQFFERLGAETAAQPLPEQRLAERNALPLGGLGYLMEQFVGGLLAELPASASMTRSDRISPPRRSRLARMRSSRTSSPSASTASMRVSKAPA